MKEFRILLVDDNPDHRFFITRALHDDAGDHLAVDSVADGEEAMAFLRGEDGFVDRTPPHLVILDLRMPRMSGLEVLEQMRQDEQLRSTPVCVLTSSDRAEDVSRAYHLGTNAYVVKKGDLDGLRREVAHVRSFWTSTSRVPEPRE